MRVIHRAVVALALVTLLALAGSAAAQSNPPAGQILTRDDVSLAFEGLWEGGCSSFGDTTTCNFQENGTPSMIDVVVRVPIEGTGASAQTLDDWRTAIDTLAGSSGLTIEAIPDVGDAALALLGTDGTAQRLEFYAGGATGSIIPRLDRPVAGRDLGGLARTAIPRLGDQTQVPISTNAPVSTNGPVPSVAAPEPATPEPTVAPVTPELATLPTPSFTGMTLNQARALAISVGVNLSSTSDATSDQPDETVLSQSPEPGTPIASGSFVDIVVARAAAGPAPTPTTTPAPVAAPVQAPGPSDISLDPVVIVTSAAAAAGIVLLIPFPSALFNSTLEANYAEIRGWFRFRRRKRTTDDARTDSATAVTAKSADEATAPDTATSDAEVEAADMTPTTAVSTTSGVVTPAALTGMGATIDRFWSTRAGVATFFVLAGLLYGFLDPTFGLTVDSVLLFVGILGALVVGSLVATATFRWARVRLNGEQGTFRVLPTTLVIALVCVLTTRITDFQPGYLYG
ncbi:MAG: PASTA domain-containing protein, partial [Chloroflexi bacterium]|nr:PASTA domain-containing protein [Chloroflexota bacterium]